MILSEIKRTVGVEEMNKLVVDKLIACFENSTLELVSENCLPDSDMLFDNDDVDFNIFIDDRDGVNWVKILHQTFSILIRRTYINDIIIIKI